MSNPFLKRFLGVALIASGFLALPVTAQKPAPKERKESRSVIRIVENGEERKIEVVEKDGKVLLNGKPIEEASAEDKELYNQFKVEDTTTDESTERRVTVTARPKAGAKTMGENEVEVTIDADGKGGVWVMPEEDEGGNQVYRWKRKSADGKEEEIEEIPRFRAFRWDRKEPLHQFKMAMPKGEFFFRESPLGDVMEDVRINIEELRGNEFAELARMEREARDLSRQIKNAKDNEKAGLERELDVKLNEIFDKKIEARRKKVSRLEEELNTERGQLRTRERAKREMIERRKQELLRGNDPLSW